MEHGFYGSDGFSLIFFSLSVLIRLIRKIRVPLTRLLQTSTVDCGATQKGQTPEISFFVFPVYSCRGDLD
jgi:hypothetical protein